MRRLVLLCLLFCLALPVAAQGQSNPFGPLPQPAAPTAEPEPIESPAEQAESDRTVLLFIAGGVLLAFVAIGFYITRDARSSLTDHDRRAIEHERETIETARTRSAQAKKQARSKTRAQKQARKKQRR